MKRILAIVLAAVMLLGLAGCGKPKTPKEVMAAVSGNMMDLDSAEINMEMTAAVKSLGIEVPLNFQGQGELFLKSMRGHLNMTMDLGIADLNMEMYSEKSGDEFINYVGVDLGVAEKWMKTVSPYSGNPAASSLLSIPMVGNLTAAEETELQNGVEVTRYDGVITGNTIPKLLAPLLVMYAGEDGMEDVRELEEMMRTIDPASEIRVTSFVETESLLLRRIDIDMTEVVDDMLRGSAEGVSVTQFTTSIRYSNFNNAREFEIPREALDAEEF